MASGGTIIALLKTAWVKLARHYTRFIKCVFSTNVSGGVPLDHWLGHSSPALGADK